jgi:hypothetical protein
MVILYLIACQSQDYAVIVESQKQPSGSFELGDVVSDSSRQDLGYDATSIPDDLRDFLTTEPENIEMRVDVALQRLMWGNDLGRCQIQISFEKRKYPPRPSGSNDSFQQLYPDLEGTCAFTRFDEQPPMVDNWYVSGELSGPSEIFLYGEQVLRLQLTSAEDGLLRYELEDCNEEDFPFAEVLSIEIPETDTEEDVSPIWLEDAFVVGPDIRIFSPGDIGDDYRYHGVDSDPIHIEWEMLQEMPTHLGQNLDVQQDIRIYNNQKDGWSGLESMICLPYSNSTQFVVPSEDISLFTLNDTPEQDEYYTAIAVQSIVHSQPFENQWGRSIQVRSLISEGGMMELINSD